MKDCSTKLLKKIVLTLTVIYISLIAFLFFFQKRLQYVPMGITGTVADYHLDNFEERSITATDGVRLLAWYKRPEKGQKIILHFHGNAGNLGDRAFKFRTFADSGFGILAVTYRGYSGSDGVPSQKGFMIDAQAALKFLLDEGYKFSDIIVFGESIGSGVAMPLAAQASNEGNPFFAVVLEAPFSSAASVAQRAYWFVPAKFLLKDKFDSLTIASQVTSPTLVFHKTRDNVVPYVEGENLFNALTTKYKKFVTVQGVGHIDFDNEFLVDEVKQFLKEIAQSDSRH